MVEVRISHPNHARPARSGYLGFILHAHLPFVRHPDQERFLEESWLNEAITETYLPLIQRLEGWWRDGLPARITFTVSPTLGAMWRDSLLQRRYRRHLEERIALAEQEVARTQAVPGMQAVAVLYRERYQQLAETYGALGGDLAGAFRRFQERGQVELITCAATHAVLPLLAHHPPSVRAQVLIARDLHRQWFGVDPGGIWLPECAYTPELDRALQEANLRWFVLDTHGLLHARPSAVWGIHAPVFTPNGLAVFGRDPESAQQVWSRESGYPGDVRYRDFYRDIGYDLDWDYVQPYLPSPVDRGFTGLKYHRITGPTPDKSVYDRAAALETVAVHADHFWQTRCAALRRRAPAMDRPPFLAMPYDAELFGHWWFEGPEFLDAVVRRAAADPQGIDLITPSDYLRWHPQLQVVTPGASSWGEAGYWRVWLNDQTAWLFPRLHSCQALMTKLTRRFAQDDGLARRALCLAANELLLAQASDWPFLLRGDHPSGYARTRLQEHLARFQALADQLIAHRCDEAWIARFEQHDLVFPELNYRYWA